MGGKKEKKLQKYYLPLPSTLLYYGVERGVKEMKINRLESDEKRVA